MSRVQVHSDFMLSSEGLSQRLAGQILRPTLLLSLDHILDTEVEATSARRFKRSTVKTI